MYHIQYKKALNLRKFLIFRTIGQGNCLFNACSIALLGDETIANSLRCLTAIELYTNCSYYANHPLIEIKHSIGAFQNISNAFAMCISNESLISSGGKDRCLAVRDEAAYISKNYQPSSFICEMALSSVIGRKIEAYYPTKNTSDLDVEKNSLETMFNCTINPRDSSLQGHVIHILRCAELPFNFAQTRKIPDHKNHFVPLLPVLPCGMEESASLQPKQSPLLPIPKDVYSESEIEFFKEAPTVSLQSQAQNSSLGASKNVSKRKQFTIESFLNEKQCFKPSNKREKSCEESINFPVCNSSEISTASSSRHVFAYDSSMKLASIEQPHTADDTLDVGKIYQSISSLNDNDRYELLTNYWKPGPSFQFPTTKGRRFNFKWLEMFPWLAYSQFLDGAFCINCVLFGGESSHNASKLQYLYKLPLNTWSNALERLKSHVDKSPIHATATMKASQFRLVMENRTKSIDLQLDNICSKQVEQNRLKLKPIVGAIVFCGRQNIALRGHRDDASYLKADANNPGNLQELLNFLSVCGNNSDGNSLLSSSAKNATYRSKTTQSEIINICGDYILHKIMGEVKNAKFYSVLADEAADISNVEQMALVLRFVDTTGHIREEFVGFVPCDQGLSGEALSNTIMQSITKIGISMDNCRGQGYDGAGNMAGKWSGAAARIQRLHPQALYVHCASHILNLCVSSSCNIPVVSNMMGHIRVISEFFNVHPKRHAVLVGNIKSMLPEASHSRLSDVCRTRWVERIDGLELFIELFLAIVSSLEDVKNNADGSWNTDRALFESHLRYGDELWGSLSTTKLEHLQRLQDRAQTLIVLNLRTGGFVNGFQFRV